MRILHCAEPVLIYRQRIYNGGARQWSPGLWHKLAMSRVCSRYRERNRGHIQRAHPEGSGCWYSRETWQHAAGPHTSMSMP